MNEKDDQKRTMTANEAIKEGSDCFDNWKTYYKR